MASVYNILDLIEQIGENEVNLALSDFSCPLNADIEHFIKHNAVNFAKQKISMTFLILSENGDILGFFTLAHKPLVINAADILQLSNTQKKRLKKHAKFDEATQNCELSAFLIAQFGKNAEIAEAQQIPGSVLMSFAIDTLCIAQHVVGGGVIFLECENKEKLLAFYQNAKNGFKKYSVRRSQEEGKEYIRLLRFF